MISPQQRNHCEISYYKYKNSSNSNCVLIEDKLKSYSESKENYYEVLSNQLKAQNYDNKFSRVIGILENIKPYISKAVALLKDVIVDNNSDTGFIKHVNSFRTEIEQVFDKKSSINISIEEYLFRICLYLDFSLPELLHTLILIDKITNIGNMILCDENIHKIIIVSSLLTCKMLNDKVLTTESYSKIYGVSKNTILELENSALNVLNYSVFVSEEDYKEYLQLLSYY